MEKIRHHWYRLPIPVRKPLILVIGLAVVVAGCVMLVLPGPGWATIFLGFAILATEFKSAEAVKRLLIKAFRAIISTFRSLSPKHK